MLPVVWETETTHVHPLVEVHMGQALIFNNITYTHVLFRYISVPISYECLYPALNAGPQGVTKELIGY